jgi:hypothetical protein
MEEDVDGSRIPVFFLEAKASARMRDLKLYDGSRRPGRTDRRMRRAQASRTRGDRIRGFFWGRPRFGLVRL